MILPDPYDYPDLSYPMRWNYIMPGIYPVDDMIGDRSMMESVGTMRQSSVPLPSIMAWWREMTFIQLLRSGQLRQFCHGPLKGKNPIVSPTLHGQAGLALLRATVTNRAMITTPRTIIPAIAVVVTASTGSRPDRARL